MTSLPVSTPISTSAFIGIALRGMAALAVAMGIGRFAFTPQLPLMQADLGVSLAAGGWLASANYLGYLAGAVLAGRQGVSAAGLMRWGLWAVVASTAAMAWPESLAWWLAMRFIAGVASAWVLVGTATVVLARLAQPGAPRLDGVVFAGVGTGIALAGLSCFGGALVHLRVDVLWLVLAGLALAGTLCVRIDTPAVASGGSARADIEGGAQDVADRAVQDDVDGAVTGTVQRAVQGTMQAAGSPAAPAAGRGADGGAREARRLVLCYGLFGFGYILPATYLPTQARLLLGDPSLFGWVWPLFGLAAALSALGTALLARWPRRRVWAVAQGVMAVGLALPAVMPGLFGLSVAAACVGGTFVLITLVGLQEARVQAGAQAQQRLAAMTAAFALGQLAGPLAANALQALGGTLDGALWLGVAALVVSSGLLSRPVDPS